MLSSKTLTERNNDPTPYRCPECKPGSFAERMAEPAEWCELDVFDPRPEFQHGKLPANPILVDFRSETIYQGTTADWAAVWLDSWGSIIQWIDGDTTTSEERTHAHRVLTLLATLKNGA